MSDELKPCPFCGERARYDWIVAGCAVECPRCHVSVMRGSVGMGRYATEAGAAADWNHRAQPAEAEGVDEFDARCLDKWLRQHCHNDGSPGFVFGYEAKGTEQLVDRLRAALSAVTAERDRLQQQLSDPEFPPKHARRLIDQLRAEVEALQAMTAVTCGVGDGSGNLFVHGDYDSIKRVQALVFEVEALRKAGRRVLDGLNARIDEASGNNRPVPVFDGIAELHAAMAAKEA